MLSMKNTILLGYGLWVLLAVFCRSFYITLIMFILLFLKLSYFNSFFYLMLSEMFLLSLDSILGFVSKRQNYILTGCLSCA